MIKPLQLIIVSFLFFAGCSSKKQMANENYKTENIQIQQVADHVYQHTSFLHTETFGNVPCNGMIVVDNKEAVIFDTPAENLATEELIKWAEDRLDCTIKAVISTHFHADCLGGLTEFHKRNIPSYAHQATIALAKENGTAVPQNGFDHLLELKVGNNPVIAEFAGEGHTKDNIIGYFPLEKVMFGGCLIKEVGAGKGNLEDANIQAWSSTVARLKEKYPDIKFVIPGHGQPGGTALLDYTIKLFE